MVTTRHPSRLSMAQSVDYKYGKAIQDRPRQFTGFEYESRSLVYPESTA